VTVQTEFEQTILPRLLATYEAGRLVPFIGSGMSAGVCTDWSNFVRRLELAAHGTQAMRQDEETREALIRRANNAVRILRAREPGTFERELAAALIAAPEEQPAVPPQTTALARLWWPLVLSTNYDNCYATAFQTRFPDAQLAIVGRTSEDCQRVLNCLSVPGRPLLWALQGYLDVPHRGREARPGDPDLRKELVVGHEEYRRVTYRDLHFRRAFAEVFRHRSLLFLGSGIQETYLQELFGEVLEQHGPTTRPHYAILPEGEVDADFMLARFQIVVVQYAKGAHDQVRLRLDALAKAVGESPRAPVAWSWGRIARRGQHWDSIPDLEIVRGPLPAPSSSVAAAEECLAVSAGGSGRAFFFSSGIRAAMESWGVPAGAQPKVVSDHLGLYEEERVYAVRARRPGVDQRSLADIFEAALALFRHAHGRFRCIRMQLLATGGRDKLDVTQAKWQVRWFPERFSLVQIVRAWAKWRAENINPDCRLALYVVQEAVYQDVASGRIDMLELLSCQDIRFFVEVATDRGEIERRLFQTLPEKTLGDIVGDLQLSPEHWTFELTPPVSLDDPSVRLLSGNLDLTLGALGVVPGSTLHIRRALGRSG
jgi:hypothetical protein